MTRGRTSRLGCAFVLGGLLLAAGTTACGGRDDRGSRPDDTAVNKPGAGHTVTPLDQSESADDRQVTQQVREALVADASLSTSAKNVRIVTAGEKVTLSGVVNGEEEHRKILAQARGAAGSRRIDDQLEVARNP